MKYHDQKLVEEIRRCLHAHRHPVHPINIQRWIERDRQDRSLAADMPYEPLPIQKLDTIKRRMRYMEDVEVVEIHGKYYRQLKKRNVIERGAQWLKQKSFRLALQISALSERLRN